MFVLATLGLKYLIEQTMSCRKKILDVRVFKQASSADWLFEIDLKTDALKMDCWKTTLIISN